jgi:glycosyltransferase involved in cell wall biosynthesis
MKVLVVASTFPTSDVDETPAFVKHLVVALARACPHLQIDVLAPQWRDRTPLTIRHEHYAEYRFPYFWPRRWQRLAGRGILPTIQQHRRFALMLPFLFLFEGIALMRHVRRHRPDVIYAHWFTPQGVMAAIVSALTGVPYVLTSHADDVRVWRKVPLAGPALVRKLLPRAKRITAVSAATCDKMRAFFSESEWDVLRPRVAVVPMGVDIASLAPAQIESAALKVGHGFDGKRVIYFIGRLVEKKGVAFLLEALSQVVRDPAHRDVMLVVAGEGPLRSILNAQAQRLGLHDHVRFIGYVSGQRKLEMLRLADIVAVPSIETASGDSEGFPVVVMEALAAGKICVATDATHTASVLTDGVSGFLVPQKDGRALAAALIRALALSGEERHALMLRARSAVAGLDWPAIARQHYAFLLEPFEPRTLGSR